MTIPSPSSMCSRSESVRGLMPGHACSSCMNRRGPSERSWTIRGVHLDAIRSAVIATEQFALWTSFMVLFFMNRSLVGGDGRCYANERIGLDLLRVCHYRF